MHEIDLQMTPDDWQSILDDTRGDEWRHATLTYDGVVVEDVGVRPAGESSRLPGNPKMSVRIKFDAFPERGKFGGRKVMKLDGMAGDLSMMRERLAFFICKSAVQVPREAAARLVVNGVLRGHYTAIEVWDSEAIEERFSRPIGPLYRIRGLPRTDPYLYVGPSPASYVPLPWEPHISMPSRGDEAIPAFLQTLASNPAGLETVADVDGLLGFLACNAVAMNTDGFTGETGVEDHFQYFDPSIGRFVILPWDPDNTFGSTSETPSRSIFKGFSRTVPGLIVRDVPVYRSRYEAKIRAVMAAVPLPALDAEAQRIYQQIRDVVYADPLKGYPNESFDWAFGYVRDFSAQRYAYLATQLGGGT